jgi:hypothetical protein
MNYQFQCYVASGFANTTEEQHQGIDLAISEPKCGLIYGRGGRCAQHLHFVLKNELFLKFIVNW